MNHHPKRKACGQPQPKTTAASIALVLLFASSTAIAECKPVLAAYAKAEATKRYAIYEVDRIDAAPKGEPTIVAIGDVEYDPNLVRKTPIDIVKVGYVKSRHDPNREIDALKAREASGKGRCESLGERRLGNVTAVGYRIRDTAPGRMSEVTAIDLWIDQATGLPVFHGMGSAGGGFHWTYGNAVVPPSGVQ